MQKQKRRRQKDGCVWVCTLIRWLCCVERVLSADMTVHMHRSAALAHGIVSTSALHARTCVFVCTRVCARETLPFLDLHTCKQWRHPPPPIRRLNLAYLAELVCQIVGFLNLADLFCRITRFLGLCRLVLPTCWGLWVLGHLSWRRHLLWDTA